MSEANDKNKIVPSTPNSLSTRSVGLVRRGLQDLTAPKLGKRILVAVGKHILDGDDQEAINEVVGEILSSAGYEVKTTTHPSEVVALAAEFRPHVVLVGLVAQEIDGVTLSEQLAAGFPDLKIVLTGKEVWEWAFRLLLHKGIMCDALECPFESKDLLGMINTWASGSDYIDPATHLRDAKHFRIGADNFRSLSKSSIIFIELERTSGHLTLENERSFLRRLGALLAGYAREGFAYRYGESQFAMLLPNRGKDEAFTSSRWFIQELKSLLTNHSLSDRYSPAIGVLSLPDDAERFAQVEETAYQLIAEAKNSKTKIALLDPFEPKERDAWTELYTERFFMEALHAEWKRSERNKLSFSLIDVHLGDFETLFGESRDWMKAVLGRMADTVLAICRRSDVPCHYNINEFLILLPETSMETACGLAQELHSRLKDAAAYVLSGYRPALILTVASYPFDGTTPVDMVRSLDEATLLLNNSTRDGVAAASKGVISPL